MSYYGGQPQQQDYGASRVRSKSTVDGRKYTQDGRPILHFGKFLPRTIVFPYYHYSRQFETESMLKG